MLIKHSSIKLAILGFLVFFVSLIQNIYTPIILNIQNYFDTSLFWVNFTIGGFIFIVAIIQIILGFVIDSANSKTLLLLATIITFIACLICGITRHFIVFATFRLIQAIGCGMIPLITMTIMADETSKNDRHNAMANYQIFLSCAPAIAPILGGLLGYQIGFKGIFFLLSFITLCFIVVITFIYIPDKSVTNNFKKIITLSYKELFSNKQFLLFISYAFVIFFSYFVVLVNLPELLTNTYHIPLKIIGFLFLPITFSIILGSIIYKKVAAFLSNTILFKAMSITLPIILLLIALFYKSNLSLLSLFIFLLGLIIGLTPSLISTELTFQYPHNKGQVLGIFNFIRYFGMALGAIIVGLITTPNLISVYIVLALITIVLSTYTFLAH